MFVPEVEIKAKASDEGGEAGEKILSIELDRMDESDNQFDPYISQVPHSRPVLLKKNRFQMDMPDDSYKMKPRFQKGTLPRREEVSFELDPIRPPAFTKGELQSSQLQAWATRLHEKSQRLSERYEKIRSNQKRDRFAVRKSMMDRGAGKLETSDGDAHLAIREYVIDAKALREELQAFRNAVNVDELRRKASE